MSTPQQPSFRYPFALAGQPHEVQQAHIFAYNAILDLQRANAVNVAKIATLKTAASSTSTVSSTTIVTNSSFPGLGTVNDQTGSTAYTVTPTDNGILLILNDASAVAVSLDSAMKAPYFIIVTNFGTGLATLTPTTGTVNGGASLDLSQGQTVWTVFDGANWKTWDFFAPPRTLTKALHEWLDSYDDATGLFTQSQPAYSDISGTPQIPNTIAPVPGEYITGYDAATGNFSQSTPAGISATITTAALTVTGTQGSMSFTGGILTAQTPAT